MVVLNLLNLKQNWNLQILWKQNGHDLFNNFRVMTLTHQSIPVQSCTKFMVKVDASCRLIFGIITNNLKISSQPYFTPPQWKTIYHNAKYLQYLLCFTSQKRSWRHFVWDYVKRIHNTIQGFPCQKKKQQNSTTQKSTRNKTSKAQYKCPTALFLFLSQRKISVFLIGIDSVLFDKGLNIW